LFAAGFVRLPDFGDRSYNLDTIFRSGESPMRIACGFGCSIVFCGMLAGIGMSQAPAAPATEETGRSVAGGGVSVPGWQGKIDDGAAKQGQTINDAKLAPEDRGMHVTTGPAVTYWNPKNMAKGDYTVSATFSEPKYMNLNDHPHPYGIVIGGNDLGTDQQSLMYCAAYGNGTFIVRGFGPAAFQLGGRKPIANDAVHKAAGVGQPVSQDIAMAVKGDKVSCSINGTVVATYDKSDVVAAGKLKSTDGVYGIRFAHNTDAIVTNFKMTRP
jgi:hypothetical protein